MHSSPRETLPSYQQAQGGGWVRPAVLLFCAKQCTASQKLEQTMTQLVPAYGDHLHFATVDAAMHEDLVRRYRIHSIPSLVIVHEDCVLYLATGVLPQGEIETMLNGALRHSRVALAPSPRPLQA